MMIARRAVLASFIGALAPPAFAGAEAQPGRIETLHGVPFGDSPPSRIRIWLPDEAGHNACRCRVLYMLDGQYAFARDNDGQSFAADRRVAQLMAEGLIPPTLIVAIDNLGINRFLQYLPQTIYDLSRGDLRDGIERELARHNGQHLVSAEFIAFLTDRLKPFVDARYPTRPGHLDNAIFGASMAGVMAGAIFVEAQPAFGRGACMSPNWAIYDERFLDYEQLRTLWPDYVAQLGAPAGRRLWLDHGTEMMDAGMAPHQAAIAQLLAELGWRAGENLQTRIYEGAGHAFAQTAVQMDEVLAWLLS